MTDMLDLLTDINKNETGNAMYRFIEELYPICRSITGDGVRATLKLIKNRIPIESFEIPTGTEVFDWSVPKEWNIRDAYIKDPSGKKIVDFKKSNLHVLNYSRPIHERLPLTELKTHLYSLPDFPDWIPYKTSYYKENWGFCLAHNQLLKLAEGDYQVCIDSSLENGALSYGEFYIPGSREDEVLFSCHVCHPSLCNDNLSGIALVTFLAKHLQHLPLTYSYRFLFIPGTIGAITWLARNEHQTAKIRNGLVVACVGDAGKFHYKKSRQGNAEIDRAAVHVLKSSGHEFNLAEFSPYGYDERQFCSPGFNLPVGSLTRTPHGRYREYHTSADNLNFIQAASLGESLEMYLRVVNVIENNVYLLNTNPKCEPQLGRRGIYSTMGGHKNTSDLEMAMLWVLNLSDGVHSLLDIAERSGMAFERVLEAARILRQHDLLIPSDGSAV